MTRVAFFSQHGFHQAVLRPVADALQDQVSIVLTYIEARASRFLLPWAQRRGEEAQELLGELWPYGIEPNRTTLEAFLGFCHEQGVCARLLAPEELVPAEVQAEFRI